MQKKMIKRLMAAIIMAVMMIYLSIFVSAADTFDSKQYWCYVYSANSTGLYFQEITTFPTQLAGTNVSGGTLFIGFKTNQIISDERIIVMQVVVEDMAPTVSNIGVGMMASGAITGSNTGAFFLNMEYEQEIIKQTVHQTADGTRVTVTIRAKGFINQYPFMRMDGIQHMNSNNIGSNINLTLASAELYETVEDAASSGTTPEEMREVLSAWGEEELLPGIQDSVESGVQSGMAAALEDEKQQANTDGNSAIDELTGALDGVVGDINQAKESFDTLGSALQYSGTSASLTFPGMNVPFLGQISEPIDFDITGYIDSTFPPQLLLLIRCAFSIGIVSYPIFELVRQLRKLLDKG